jgi:dinuclear metal center YbgI/SA1388 family protein
MSLTQQQLTGFFNSLLQPGTFNDYGPNGLQIEGAEKINKIAFAVSATRHSVYQASDNAADALVVHHGLFWKFHGSRTLTGPFARRVFPVIKNSVNLYAYHLPLDAHAQIGNAAVLGNLIDCQNQEPFGDYQGSPTGIKGNLAIPLSAIELQQKLTKILNHPVIMATRDANQIITTLGIITGGANSEWQLASQQGLDAYLTGEISEHDWHESKEAGIHMFAGGHNATEKFGIQALMACTQKQFDVSCFYIHSENPA